MLKMKGNGGRADAAAVSHSRFNRTLRRLFQFASCYGGGRQLQIFGRGPGGAGYLSLFGYRGPCFAPRPRLVGHNPKMTVRQIIRMLKTMKRVRTREAAAAAAAASR